VLELIARFRSRDGAVPIVLMAYANPLLRRGWREAARALADAGADGLLVADVPVDEGAPAREAALDAGLCPIFFASPTSSDERIAASAAASRGFLYTILRTGVTGGATALDASAERFLARVRANAGELPLAVGFGIADEHHVRAAVEHAELAIVGSALVDAIHRASSGAAHDRPARAAAAAHDFLRRLSRGLPP
jgi:tryptophan synthase alpha chain